MEVIIVVSKRQRGVIQDLHREVWSLSGELWQGDSIVINWTLKKSLETSICHIMGRLKLLFDRQFAIHPGFLLQVQEKDKGVLLKSLLQNVKLEKFNEQNLCNGWDCHYSRFSLLSTNSIKHKTQQCASLSLKMNYIFHGSEGKVQGLVMLETGSAGSGLFLGFTDKNTIWLRIEFDSRRDDGAVAPWPQFYFHFACAAYFIPLMRWRCAVCICWPRWKWMAHFLKEIAPVSANTFGRSFPAASLQTVSRQSVKSVHAASTQQMEIWCAGYWKDLEDGCDPLMTSRWPLCPCFSCKATDLSR